MLLGERQNKSLAYFHRTEAMASALWLGRKWCRGCPGHRHHQAEAHRKGPCISVQHAHWNPGSKSCVSSWEKDSQLARNSSKHKKKAKTFIQDLPNAATMWHFPLLLETKCYSNVVAVSVNFLKHIKLETTFVLNTSQFFLKWTPFKWYRGKKLVESTGRSASPFLPVQLSVLGKGHWH